MIGISWISLWDLLYLSTQAFSNGIASGVEPAPRPMYQVTWTRSGAGVLVIWTIWVAITTLVASTILVWMTGAAVGTVVAAGAQAASMLTMARMANTANNDLRIFS